MLASFLNAVFAISIEALPRLFLFGAPFLIIGIVLAALVDAKLPGNDGGAPTR